MLNKSTSQFPPISSDSPMESWGSQLSNGLCGKMGGNGEVNLLSIFYLYWFLRTFSTNVPAFFNSAERYASIFEKCTRTIDRNLIRNSLRPLHSPKHFRDHIKTNYSSLTLETSKLLVSKQDYQIVIIFRINNTCSVAWYSIITLRDS